jgi:excisionase family DNA binding protein
MPTPQTSRRLITMREACERVSVSDDTIRRRIAAGQLTGYKFGPRILRIDVDELDACFRPIPNAGE